MSGFGTDLIPGLIAGKPVIPAWNTVDLGQQQTKAISENQNSLPSLETLASGTNTFNLQQLTQALQTMIPGYDALTKGAASNIESELAGKIPQDVSDAIQNSDAAKALTGGFGGSSFGGNLTARDLGLTSLQLTQQGTSAAQSWITSMGQLTQPSLFNLTSMFVTPQQQFEDTMSNQEMQFQRDYVSNMNDYQHSFKKLLADDVQGTANTLLSMFGGSMFGGMGGGSTKAPNDTDSGQNPFAGGGGAMGD